MDFSVYQRSLGERRKGGKYGRQHYGGLRLAPNQVITVPESESIEMYYSRQEEGQLIEVSKLLGLAHTNRTKPDLVQAILDFHEKAQGRPTASGQQRKITIPVLPMTRIMARTLVPPKESCRLARR